MSMFIHIVCIVSLLIYTNELIQIFQRFMQMEKRAMAKLPPSNE